MKWYQVSPSGIGNASWEVHSSSGGFPSIEGRSSTYCDACHHSSVPLENTRKGFGRIRGPTLDLHGGPQDGIFSPNSRFSNSTGGTLDATRRILCSERPKPERGSEHFRPGHALCTGEVASRYKRRFYSRSKKWCCRLSETWPVLGSNAKESSHQHHSVREEQITQTLWN